jgi:hypothetical protein
MKGNPMPISIRQSQAGNIASQSIDDLYRALRDVQADLEQLRALLATHVHSGVTTGAGNSGAPTVTIAAAALNTQP